MYVTAWSEVRVLPPEPIPQHPAREVLGPIDTTLEPMFYRWCARLRELRREVSRPDRHRWAEAEPPRSEAVSRLPTAPTAPQTTKVRCTPAEVACVRRLRQRVPSKDGHRWEDALALPAPLLPRMLALRRPQHIEGSTRTQVHTGGHESATRPAAGAVSALTSQEAP